MIPALRAEFRKLLTVRSTYIITGIALFLLALLSFYIEGYKSGMIRSGEAGGSLYLADTLTQHSMILGIFASIVALLLMTHEYRYNTITYTLTAVNRRCKVLVAKITTVFVYTFVLMLVGGLVGLGGMIIGLHFGWQSLPHQDISLLAYLGKMLFYGEGLALAALFLAALLRNQVAALAVLLLMPNIGETLLSLIVKGDAKYLPFNALSQVIIPPAPTELHGIASLNVLTPLQGALVFCTYLVIGWAIAWLLFLYRDAS